MRDRVIFIGQANTALGLKVSEHIDNFRECKLTRFSDGELFFSYGSSVRGADAYVIQSTCGSARTAGWFASQADNLMELCLMADALKRGGAASVTAIIPYFGYARQDRLVAPRTPLTAKLVADMMVSAGIDRVVTLDPHSMQLQGFFNTRAFDALQGWPAFQAELYGTYRRGVTVVSPDAGGVKRARSYAKKLLGADGQMAPLAIIDKRRDRANVSEAMHVIGDVTGQRCLMVDDMIDTAGTLVSGAEALMRAGASEVSACATHAVLSGPAIDRITKSPLTQIFVSDTIPLSDAAIATEKFVVVSVAELLANAIRRIHNCDSVSGMFT